MSNRAVSAAGRRRTELRPGGARPCISGESPPSQGPTEAAGNPPPPRVGPNASRSELSANLPVGMGHAAHVDVELTFLVGRVLLVIQEGEGRYGPGPIVHLHQGHDYRPTLPPWAPLDIDRRAGHPGGVRATQELRAAIRARRGWALRQLHDDIGAGRGTR